MNINWLLTLFSKGEKMSDLSAYVPANLAPTPVQDQTIIEPVAPVIDPVQAIEQPVSNVAEPIKVLEVPVKVVEPKSKLDELEDALKERIAHMRALVKHLGQEAEEEVIKLFDKFPIGK